MGREPSEKCKGQRVAWFAPLTFVVQLVRAIVEIKRSC